MNREESILIKFNQAERHKLLIYQDQRQLIVDEIIMNRK